MGCVPDELFLASQAEGGADGGRDASGDARHEAASCPTPADCANPACKSLGYVCSPPAPPGWSMAAVDFTGDGACPSGYGKSTKLATQPTSATTCGCSCALATAPSCVTGDIEFATGAAASSCITKYVTDVNDGACTPASVTLSAYTQFTGTPGATGGTCTGTPMLPPTESTTDDVCVMTGALPTAGCSGGDVCVATTSSRKQCIIEEGSSSCAGAYSVAHPVGASVEDTRTCTGACTCGAPTATCIDQAFTLYAGPNCTGTSFSNDLDGACDPTHAACAPFKSYKYTATASGEACGTATGAPTVSGSVSLVGPETLCCLP
jgi:hypothetical protein